MAKKTLISIAVPTYNRESAITQNIPVISDLLSSYNADVFISDNCSTDNTWPALKRIVRDYKNITMFRQKNNIGDKNFEFVLKNSSGKYVWLLADRTIPRADNFSELYKSLSYEKYDCVIVNDGSSRVSDISSREYNNPVKLLEDIGWHMTQISSIILSRKFINAINFERFSNTNFMHTAGIFEQLAKNSASILWLNKPLFENKFKNIQSGWRSNVFDVFFDSWANSIMSLPPYYSIESKLVCIKNHGVKSGLFTLKGFIEFRKDKIFNISIFKKYKSIIHLFTNVPKFILFILALTPTFPIKIEILLYKKMFKKS
jgi:abequosyltransferase